MKRPSAALVVATLALFVALSDAGYAAFTLPANSVTTKQVKDHSLLRRDFAGGQVPAGPAGPPGSAGATNVTVRFGTPVAVAPGAQVIAKAECNTGERATGGGFKSGNDLSTKAVTSRPDTAGGTATGWVAIGHNTGNVGSTTDTFQALVICASP